MLKKILRVTRDTSLLLEPELGSSRPVSDPCYNFGDAPWGELTAGDKSNGNCFGLEPCKLECIERGRALYTYIKLAQEFSLSLVTFVLQVPRLEASVIISDAAEEKMCSEHLLRVYVSTSVFSRTAKEEFETQWLGNLELSLVIVIHLHSYNLAFKVAG